MWESVHIIWLNDHKNILVLLIVLRQTVKLMIRRYPYSYEAESTIFSSPASSDKSASSRALITVFQVVGFRPLPWSHSLNTVRQASTDCWGSSFLMQLMSWLSKCKLVATDSHLAAARFITFTVFPLEPSIRLRWWSLGTEEVVGKSVCIKVSTCTFFKHVLKVWYKGRRYKPISNT